MTENVKPTINNTQFIKTLIEDIEKLIKEPKNADIIKRTSLSIMIALSGGILSISLISIGLAGLIEAGVPEKTITLCLGCGCVVLGVMCGVSASRTIGKIVYWKTEKKDDDLV